MKKIEWKIPFLNRLDRYLMGKFLGTYFFSIILIISIAVVFDYNENIDKFTKNNAPLHDIIFVYYLNFIPYYANLFSSLFVFLSVIFFTTKLADNSEIIAMQAAGVKFTRIMRPYMLSAALIAIITFVLGSEVIPRGSLKRLNFEKMYKSKNRNVTTATNLQLQVDTGVIAFMEHYDDNIKMGMHFSLDKFENKKLVSHLFLKLSVCLFVVNLRKERGHFAMRCPLSLLMLVSLFHMEGEPVAAFYLVHRNFRHRATTFHHSSLVQHMSPRRARC